MTGRLLNALDSPYVHILAHPTGRLLGVRKAMRFDFDAVLKKTIDRRIARQVSGAWQRLELNDVMARAA
jgi:DNA polymerase (family 10)